MHELTVIENVMNISRKVAEENNLKRINAVYLDVGCMQHLNEEIMKHGFESVKEGTVFSEAELRFNRMPVKLECDNCMKTFTPEENAFHCPFCGNKDTRVIQGMELQIRSIEGE